MFRSRSRPLVFTQYEHMRMAGLIAQHWGNSAFAKPELPWPSFVTGVALHDFGYGLLDTLSIGEMTESESQRAMRQFIDCKLDDKVSETVMLFHAVRLMTSDRFAPLRNLANQQIEKLLSLTGISRQRYQQADTITAFCDRLAFDFCFEQPARDTLSVCVTFKNEANTEIRYELDASGTIRLAPWPLKVPCLEGYMIAFDADAYPQALQPHWVNYRIEPGFSTPRNQRATAAA